MPSRHNIKRERANLKVQIGYVTSTPRCQTCDHFEAAETVLIAENRRAYSPPNCGRYHLPIRAEGLCDGWQRGDEQLDAED